MSKGHSYTINLKIENALGAKQRNFAIEHEADTEDELLEYLKSCAERIGHSPNPCEVIGGEYIAMRFNGWENAVSAVGLPAPGIPPRFENRLIYKEEAKRQIKIFKANRQNKAEQRKHEQEKETPEEKAAQEAERRKRDEEFAKIHKNDTDDQLLEYLRLCAEQLGHPPFKREVIGGEFIKERFALWSVALWQAGLPMAQGMRPPTEKEMRQYRAGQLKRIREAKAERGRQKQREKENK